MMFTMNNWPEKPKRKQRVHTLTNLYELHNGSKKVDKARAKLKEKMFLILIGGFALMFWSFIGYQIAVGLCK